MPPIIQAPSGHRHKSKGQDGVITILPVRACVDNCQSQQGLVCKWARISKQTSLMGQHPLVHSFLFLLFYIFYFIYLTILLSIIIIIIKINQINFSQ